MAVALVGTTALSAGKLVTDQEASSLTPASSGESPRPDRPGDRAEVDVPPYVRDRSNNGASRSGTRQETGRANRGNRERPALPDWLSACTSKDSAKEHGNGQLPEGELCELPGGDHLLHPDAARAWWVLNRKYKARFGSDLCLTDSYRSLEAQQSLAGRKPGLAATPGTSNHGWGVAMDMCGGVESFDSVQHQWLRENGEALGWINPDWAQTDGSKPEPWHWEFLLER